MRPTLLNFRLALAFAALALPRAALAGDPVPGAGPEPAPGPVEYQVPVAPPPPARWGLHSGDTAGAGSTLIYGEMGWPDISLGFQRGVSADVDVGFRASFIYGIDYVVPRKRPNNVTD